MNKEMSAQEINERKLKIKDTKRRWYEANKDKNRAACKKYYSSNRDSLSEKQAVYYKENRERLLAYSIRWAKDNPQSAALAEKKLRAKRIKRVPRWYSDLDDFVISEAISLCRDRKDATGIDWHVDHMIPMNARRASGLHVWNNVQCIPAFLNRHKKNNLIMTEPFQWIEYIKINQ